MEKIINQKVITICLEPLGSRVLNFFFQVHFKVLAVKYCSHYLPPVLLTVVANFPMVWLTSAANLPPVSMTPAVSVAKFNVGVIDTHGKFASGVVDTDGAP
jgi:hypothetical protein